jgi:hypothetical protein
MEIIGIDDLRVGEHEIRPYAPIINVGIIDCGVGEYKMCPDALIFDVGIVLYPLENI